jgi:AcrR family transcriptional regulator
VRARPRLLVNEHLPAAPVQKRSLAKRERLKKAALHLFGEKGYEGTSIEEIARRAKLAVGTFYQHFRSKRQLLLVLMDELLEGLAHLDLKPTAMTGIEASLRELLARGFSHDLTYLGACRAWQEAALADEDLARKQKEIQSWTTARVTALFHALQRLPGARTECNIASLAQMMDQLFWNILAQASRLSKRQINQRIDAATHLLYHALFLDASALRR